MKWVGSRHETRYIIEFDDQVLCGAFAPWAYQLLLTAQYKILNPIGYQLHMRHVIVVNQSENLYTLEQSRSQGGFSRL